MIIVESKSVTSLWQAKRPCLLKSLKPGWNHLRHCHQPKSSACNVWPRPPTLFHSLHLLHNPAALAKATTLQWNTGGTATISNVRIAMETRRSSSSAQAAAGKREFVRATFSSSRIARAVRNPICFTSMMSQQPHPQVTRKLLDAHSYPQSEEQADHLIPQNKR